MNKSLEALKDVSESIADLYKNHPQIAGEYFGAALDIRIKDIVTKATKGGK
jgi:hypothetical protein